MWRISSSVASVLAGEPVCQKMPRQVPDGQPEVQGVELGVQHRRLGVERIEVRDEVAADPVHVDQRLDVDLLEQVQVLPLGLDETCVGVPLPADGLVGDRERLEHVLVEAVAAGQAFRHVGEETTRLRALDDAVVVRRGEGHRLAHAEIGEHPGIRRLESGREPERTDAHDEPLPGHEAGDRLARPEGPRVGQRDRGSREVVGGDLVGRDLPDQLLVRAHEPPEVHRVGARDARHEQGPAAVALFDVDRETRNRRAGAGRRPASPWRPHRGRRRRSSQAPPRDP